VLMYIRAIGDQVENNPNKHHEYRATIVTFMERNRGMFEPFLDAEHDGTFEEYLLSMFLCMRARYRGSARVHKGL
jgi:hypothetical protein